MAPKSSKGKKGGSADFVKDEQLQAIVLSDSYETRFMPLAMEKPRCLLPLANTPLIEYTLEFLATAGVSEVYVICSSHAKQVEKYLKSSKWNQPTSPFSLSTIASPGSHSVGDVMRELDNKGLIRSDFLLISGDIVCNFDFSKILEAHKARKNKDRNAIMTMVLRESTALHRSRQRNDPGVFILDEESGRCLRYEQAKTTRGHGGGSSLLLDEEILTAHSSVSFRNDLIDCHIDICAPDVPALFQENFDYDDMRVDFVRGILTSDILGKTIYTHVIKDKYASRVQSQQTYDSVSKDVVSRYAYPIAPDYNFLDDQCYSYQHGHIYKENEVVLAQSCIIERSTVIGTKTFIGSDTRISGTVIGRRCRIGDNVSLKSSYIWDNVTIEDGVTIDRAIVADGAVIKAGATILPGSIISFGVVVGTGVTIGPNVKVTTKAYDNYDPEEDAEDAVNSDDERGPVAISASDPEVVGPDGIGIVYKEDEEGEGDNVDIDGLVYSMSLADISSAHADSDVDDEAVVESGHSLHSTSNSRKKGHRRTLSRSSATYSDTLDGSDDEETFLSEAMASIERSINENHTQEVAMLELKTLKMTMNASYEEVREATMAALVAHITKQVNEDSQDVKTATKRLFSAYTPMISKQIFENEEQVDLLHRLQGQCARRPLGPKIFLWAVMELYDSDILEEDYITEWWEDDESDSTKSLASVKHGLAPWYEWLKNAEEEDSDSDSDEE